MHLAIKGKIKSLVPVLVSHNADPNLLNKDQDNATTLAQKTGQHDLMASLAKGGGKLRPISSSGSKFRQLKGF